MLDVMTTAAFSTARTSEDEEHLRVVTLRMRLNSVGMPPQTESTRTWAVGRFHKVRRAAGQGGWDL
eukprot:4898683-Prymnesium_polylepis.1